MVSTLETFLLAMLCGLAVAAPPGPLGASCARASVERGPRAGLAVGLAIAAGDGVHAFLASSGGMHVDALPRALRFVGCTAIAALLTALAVRAWSRTSAARFEAPPSRASALRSFLLALATPGTLPAYLVGFGALGLIGARPAVAAFGGAAGSLAWWGFVCAASHGLRGRIASSPRLFERACGALFLLGACGALRAALV